MTHAPVFHQGQEGIPLQGPIILNLGLYFIVRTQGVTLVTVSRIHPLLLLFPVFQMDLVLKCSVVKGP